jgi:hypothetical protein
LLLAGASVRGVKEFADTSTVTVGISDIIITATTTIDTILFFMFYLLNL